MRTLPVVGLLLMSVLLIFVNLGATPLRLNAEERCAEVVQSMIATNDYIVPRMDGEIRLNKPPLFYWAASLFSELTGGFSLYALRLPSALCGTALVVLMLLWAGSLNAPREALIAAGALPVTYLFVQQARLGSFEMMLAFFCQATLFTLTCLVKRPRWRTGLLAALFFSLALMTKGTPAFAVVLLPAAVWIIGMGQKRWLLDPRVLLLFSASILAGLAWYGYLIVTRPEIRKILLAIALLPFGVDGNRVGAEHYEGPHFFVLKIWEEAFPLSLLLPLAAFHVWRNRMFPAASPWRLVALSFVVPLLVFSIIPQKQDHYLLPMLAPLALLCGKSAVWGVTELRGRLRLLVAVPAWVLGLVLVLGGAVGVLGFALIADWSRLASALMGAALIGAGVFTALAATRGRWIQGLAAGLAGLAVIWVGYFGVLNPVIDNFGSGRIYFDSRYSPQPWENKFRRYPLLVRILDVKRGLRHVDEVEKELESGQMDVTPMAPPRLP